MSIMDLIENIVATYPSIKRSDLVSQFKGQGFTESDLSDNNWILTQDVEY